MKSPLALSQRYAVPAKHSIFPGALVKKVLVNKPIHADALKRLSEEVEVLTPFTSPATEVISMLEEVHGLILCAGLNVTAEVMDRFQSMRVIGRHGAGLDFVDVQAARAGIRSLYQKGQPIHRRTCLY
jgi:phosphoglycerate dehydrogenase-like enzyme